MASIADRVLDNGLTVLDMEAFLSLRLRIAQVVAVR